jgi:Kef-type K+ transport system membrane component KefB
MAQGCLGANRITIRRLPLYLIVNPASRTSPLAMTACIMEHLQISQILGILVVMLLAAKVSGYLAQRAGQPAVLGELLGGVLVGKSVLGLVNPELETIHVLSELGVVILLFAIGLETDLGRLLKVGATSLAVALAGVFLPFALGFAACRLLGQNTIVSIVAAATLTATSVGITARVLSDLGRLHEPEGQIILGAAVIDDILGLLILGVVAELTEGREVSGLSILQTTASALGFLVAALLIGTHVVPALFRWAGRIELPGTATALALIAAFGLAWLADRCGSAMIIGAFAAGLLIVRAPQSHEIERGITEIGHFFVPLFFVAVGASVDLKALNPLDPLARNSLLIGLALIITGVAGKLAAGYAPFWFRGNKAVIGVGMVPRGEVGLIFAQAGLASGVFDAGLFGGVTMMVIVTTLLAPPVLKYLLGPAAPTDIEVESEGIDELVNEV